MIKYLKEKLIKNKEKKDIHNLRDKIDKYIEDAQGKILENEKNYINEMFEVLNKVARHNNDAENEKNYQTLLAFIMQKTVPLYFKDYEGTAYEVQGYKEINALLNNKFENMIINSDDHSFKVWKKLKNETSWEDYPTAIVVLRNIFTHAEIEREKRILSEKTIIELPKIHNKNRI